MTDGFLKVAAAIPRVRVADIAYNTQEIDSLVVAGDVVRKGLPAVSGRARRTKDRLRLNEFEHASRQVRVRPLLFGVSRACGVGHLLRPDVQCGHERDIGEEYAPIHGKEERGDAGRHDDRDHELLQEDARQIHDHLEIALEQGGELACASGGEPSERKLHDMVALALLDAAQDHDIAYHVSVVFGKVVRDGAGDACDARDDRCRTGSRRPPGACASRC